jgi:hypothetical protein
MYSVRLTVVEGCNTAVGFVAFGALMCKYHPLVGRWIVQQIRSRASCFLLDRLSIN